MRSMVSALRDDEAPELAPQAGVRDISRLAQVVPAGPSVRVEFDGDLDDLRPLLNTALYRLAQESITNAVRHARNASSVLVRVSAGAHEVELTVTDDGEPSSARTAHVPGFGLMGMSERVKLLGGTFAAGPDASQGWTTRAVLPRQAVGG